MPTKQVVLESPERKREVKKVEKSVRRALKWGKSRGTDVLSAEKEKQLNDVFEKALVSLQATGCN